MIHSFFFRYDGPHRALHSFPTRRSSDLVDDPGKDADLVRELVAGPHEGPFQFERARDRKSTRLNSSHVATSYAVFCLKKKKTITTTIKERMDSMINTVRTPMRQTASTTT